MNAGPLDVWCGTRPVFLHSISIPRELRVLVLAPHPDDFDAIGATMRLFHQNGNPIFLGVATSGASGVQDGFSGCTTPGAKAALREDEQRASCRFFGLEESRLSFLRLEEDDRGDPSPDGRNLERIRTYLANTQPDLVFMPHGNDSNAGHRRTYSLFRQSAERLHHRILVCLNRDPKTIEMRTDMGMLFGENEASWKSELLRHHRSQHRRNLDTRGYGFDERILRINREIAESLGHPGQYAEAFQLERFL